MSRSLSAETIAGQAFLSACNADIEAIKPGNVSVASAAHAMCAEDFIRSAEAVSEVFFEPRLSLGKRILRAIEATRKVVRRNTNLGIVLISAPVVQAVFHPQPAGLRAAVQKALSSTTVEDAVDAYKAIRLAEPGGLGRSERADVSTTPQISLREAMAYAQERDLLAAQYVNGYHLVFAESLPRLLALFKRWGYNSLWPVTGAYMALLAKHLDSLVVRKQGAEQAEDLRRRAADLASRILASQQPEQFRHQLMELDRSLKSEGINPGTTADLIVVTAFIAKLKPKLVG